MTNALSEEEIENIHRETGIAKETLRMIDKGMEEMEKGNVGEVPNLTDEEVKELFNES